MDKESQIAAARDEERANAARAADAASIRWDAERLQLTKALQQLEASSAQRAKDAAAAATATAMQEVSMQLEQLALLQARLERGCEREAALKERVYTLRLKAAQNEDALRSAQKKVHAQTATHLDPHAAESTST